MTRLKNEVLKRIERRSVERSSGCRVIEKIYKNSQGYGTIRVAGKMYLLHRVIFWLGSIYETIEDMPEGMQVAHGSSGCKEMCCVIFDHYSLVTAREHGQHKIRDGTQCVGEAHQSATITQQIAQDIANSWKPLKHELYKTQAQRALDFGVRSSIVADIDSRRTWSTVIHPNGRIYKSRKDEAWSKRKEALAKILYGIEEIKKIRQRLFDKSVINQSNGCHDFIGKYRDVPVLSIFHQTKSAGRWAAIVATGRCEANLQALHNCGRGSTCINPDHLRWGTVKENMQDKKIHGTTSSKITDDQLIEIKRSKNTFKELMAIYGLGYSTVCQIKKGTYRRLLAQHEKTPSA